MPGRSRPHRRSIAAPIAHPAPADDATPAPPAHHRARRRKLYRLLLVDPRPRVADDLARILADRPVILRTADSLASAQRRLAGEHTDMVLVARDLPDGPGLRLLDELARSRRATQAILLCEEPRLDHALEALRHGAADLLATPLVPDDAALRIDRALARQRHDLRLRLRLRRLRRVCQKLNKARHEIGRQVDVLCTDLVGAYQELAAQMQNVVQTSEYSAVIRQELDLEQLLRKTLEFLLEKAGPTNAAIFLPATGDEFSLGGYINYDYATGSPDVLLQHLADVVAPRVAERDAAVHLTDNDSLTAWIGDDATYLLDCHLLGVTARHRGETLAVLALFRDANQPFDSALVESLEAVAPLMAEYLARIIRVHHRHIADPFGLSPGDPPGQTAGGNDPADADHPDSPGNLGDLDDPGELDDGFDQAA